MVPEGLGDRGAALWAKLGQASEFDPSGVLAVEACRVADRLNVLEAMVQAGDIAVLQESRLQAAALKALLESPVLRFSEGGKVDPVDDLTRAREARRSAASGSHGA